MSKKAPVVIAAETVTDLNNDEVFKTDGKTKAFHQYFTLYFIGILLICTLASSITLMFAYQQSKQSQALINEQLAPLQIQFQQQSYLLKANNLIDDILQNSDVHYLISLQQQLSLQAKKLSLLKSQHNSNYQQWFLNNIAATELVSRIASSHASNEQLKNKGLIQLDTLLDAIEIQLNNSDVDTKTKQILSTVRNKLSIIVIELERLSLRISLEEFSQLQTRIDEMFVADYGKMLASQRRDNQGLAEIVRDFIHFEDMVLKRGLLIKWQGHLRLMGDYQHQLMSEQQQLQSILVSLSTDGQSSNDLFSSGIIDNSKIIVQSQLPIWLWVSFALALVSLAVLLWFIRLRIKVSSQHSVDYISHALAGGSTSLNNKDRTRLMRHNAVGFYCAESYFLVEKIQQLNESRISETDYLALVKKNQDLEAQTVKVQAKQERLKLALQQADLNTLEKLKFANEQLRCEELYSSAIKQLVLLGYSAVAQSNNTKRNGESGIEENYLYQAYLQNCDLVRQFKQESCKRYLQSGDAILTLSDENLVAQIEAVILNLVGEFSIDKNQVSLVIDEKIQAVVNLDVELFTEMFRAFICLLLSQKTQPKLVLSLQLIDKNNGQQTLSFSGQVQGGENLKQLPQRLESFNETNCEQNGLGEYFTTLLQYQHGENTSAILIEQGYKLSFIMPLAVTNTKQERSYTSMTLPAHLPSIDQAITRLMAKYLTMPIEALLAVKSPEQYQRLQQLLQALGLQVSFVSSERMLESQWHSGRFAVLMTEFLCTPFMTTKQSATQEIIALPRGVFILDNNISVGGKEEFTHWNLGQLSANSSIDELVTAMKPWIKEQESESVSTEALSKVNRGNENESEAGLLDNPTLPSTDQAHSFNFERYIKNQGSPALALYMIDEYTSENSVVVEQLVIAFYANDVANIDIAIQALSVNAKILAADYLLHLCDHWQKLISNQYLDNSQGVQISLLNKTKQAVEAINLHANAVA